MNKEYWEQDLRTTALPVEWPPVRAQRPTLRERAERTFEKWRLVLFFMFASLFFEVGYFTCWATHTFEPPRLEAVVYPVDEP